MNLLLERDVCARDCTLGKLSIDGAFSCYTVEDVVRPEGEKIHGRTAIPSGRYRVVITHSPRFNRNLPLLLDVPNFEGIRIHAGNTAADTEGCILPGFKRTANGVAESRLAFEALYSRIAKALDAGAEVWMEVRQ